MKAFIFAGGKATRLRRENTLPNVPKGLIKIGDLPILGHQVLSLKKAGIGDIRMLVGCQKEQIMDYFGNGHSWGINIQYEPDTPDIRGTAHMIKAQLLTLPETDADALVMHGDIFSTIDLGKLRDEHRRNKNMITLYGDEIKLPIGIIVKNQDGTVRLIEKPDVVENGSIAVVQKELAYALPSEENLDFFRFIAGYTGRIGQYVEKGSIRLHVNTQDDLIRANEIYSEHFKLQEREGNGRSEVKA